MILKFIYQVAGGHTHVSVFIGKALDQTFAKCGDLCFDNDQWIKIEKDFCTTEFPEILCISQKRGE